MSLSRRLSAALASVSAMAGFAGIYPTQGALAQPAAFRTPQFVATAVKFKSLHETHSNWMGSDEVYGLFYDFTQRSLRRTSTFDDVDAGETRDFAAADSCISPLPTCDRGASSLSFGIALMEKDQPPFYYCHGALSDASSPTSEQYEGYFDALDGQCDDDLIGKAKVKLSQAELLTALPAVGASFDRTATLTGGDGRYELTYRVTRLPNRIGIPPIGPAVEIVPITLQATAMVTPNGPQVTLAWSGASSNPVDINRDGAKLTDTPNDGDYVDKQVAAATTYRYRVCNLGTTTCSAEVVVVVP